VIMVESAGLLMYKYDKNVNVRVFLVHPGGPYWKGKDKGAWGIPKGLIDPNEDPFKAAIREFKEETGITPHGPFIPLGEVQQRSGKIVHAWAIQGDFKGKLKSNMFEMEWPPKSGKIQKFPEVDRAAWFSATQAKEKINPAQYKFIEVLLGQVQREDEPGVKESPTIVPEPGSRSELPEPEAWPVRNPVSKTEYIGAIGEEYGAVERYKRMLKDADPGEEHDMIKHILDEELEHVQELKTLSGINGIPNPVQRFLLNPEPQVTREYLEDTKLTKKELDDVMGILGKISEPETPSEPPEDPIATPIEDPEDRTYEPEKDTPSGDTPPPNCKPEPPCKKWFHSKRGTSTTKSTDRMCRHCGYNELVTGGQDGYKTKIKNYSSQSVTPTGKSYPIIYRGKGELHLKKGEWTPIPVISMNSELVSYSTSDGKDDDIEFMKDNMNNHYVRPKSGGKFIKLAYNIGEDGDYYYLKSMPSSLTLSDVKPHHDAKAVDSKIKNRIKPLLPKLKLDEKKPLKELITDMATFFANFDCNSIKGTDMVVDSIENGRGACRHRALGFYIVANILGIPCHYLTSDCHAFVEVGDGDGHWWGLDLGGCMPEGAEMEPDTDPTEEVPQYGDPDEGDKPDQPEGPGESPKDPDDDRGDMQDQYIAEIKQRFEREFRETYKATDDEVKRAMRAFDDMDIPRPRR
jgi:predicted NUDIX family NTP pyrophosphohydrolase